MSLRSRNEFSQIYHQNLCRRIRKRRNQAGTLADFPAAIAFLFLVFAFPLLNLVFLSVAAACIYLTATQTAQQASRSQTYNDALQCVKKEADYINGSGFAQFVKMVPQGGYSASGIDLYVQRTGLGAGTQTYGPNTPVSDKIDSSNNIYEYRAAACYDVSPFVDMSSVPLIQNIPGLGKPARINLTAYRACEFPMGLAAENGSFSYSGGLASAKFSAVTGLEKPGILTDTSNSGWNTPGIYQMIADAGQTVVGEEVITVDSKNYNWTSSHLNVTPGDKIWIDYKADGNWSIETTFCGYTNANGNSGYTANGFLCGAMIGRMGSGAPFLLGDHQWNMTPPGLGTLQLMMNEADFSLPPAQQQALYVDNGGIMAVRIIVSR